MKRGGRLKKYAELFRRYLRQYLAAGVKIQTTIYPVDAEGAVFEFLLVQGPEEKEEVRESYATVGRVLSSIPQRIVAGNLDNTHFGGTNLFLEGNRILVIKGEDADSSWSGEAVKDDVKRTVGIAIGSEADGED